MKTSIQLLISETAELLRVQLQDLQREILDVNNNQLVLARTRTPYVNERIDFLNKIVALEKEEQYIKGKFDCAVTLLCQLS